MNTRTLWAGLLLLSSLLPRAAGAATIDTTASGDRSTLTNTISTSPFSTHATNELLLAFISSDSTGGTVQVTGVSGAGLTWVLVGRSNAQLGTAEIWRAFAPAVLSNVTVSGTLSQSVAASITVVTFSDVDTSGTNGSGAVGAVMSASGASGAPAASLVTTRANSWVLGAGTDWDSPTPRVLPADQTMIHQYAATVGDFYWVQRQNAPTPDAGTTVTINDTAPTTDRWNLVICEVRGPGSLTTSTLSGTISPADSGAGTVVSLSGGSSQRATVDASGAYGFTGLADGTYTVTPARSGFQFSPAQQTVTIAGADRTGVNFTAAAVTGNPIVVENAKAGTSDWRLTNPSFGGEVEGYAGATSVNRGSPIVLYVNSNGAAFTLDVYRLGWYQGLGARLVVSAGLLPGQAQPACPQDSTYGLIECRWNPTTTISTQADWTSGAYLAKMRRTDTGKDNYLTFVVRDDASTSDILFDSNVNTMQAYNAWGGKALYAGLSSGAQPTRSISVAAVKVSFDRPYQAYDFFGSTDGEDTQFLRWEYQMVRWLELQGFDVTYSTNIDTATNGALLLNHRTYLSAGHGEYWPSAIRNNVEAAVNAGINLAIFGANTGYWQVRFEPSSSGVANRVMVGYKESASTFDPLVRDPAQSTSRFRDGFIQRPENVLLGSMWGDFTGTANGFPYVVANSTHRVYRNTGLVDGSSIPGLVGDEWDNLNGQTSSNMPANIPGLVVLSNSPTSSSIHNAVVHQKPSGAIVFNAGTFQWSWGLDNTLTPINAVDSRVAQMTANVLVDMGALPQTPSNVTISTGQPVLSSISGTIAPAADAAGTTLLATGPAGSVTTTANATGGYVFSNLSDGSYTITPSRTGFTFTPPTRTVTVNGANVSGVDFSVQATTTTTSMAIDVQSSSARSTASTTIASPAFTTGAADELLLAFVEAGAASPGVQVSRISGAGLTWVLVGRASVQLGTAEIWRAFAPSVVSNATVTATLSQNAAASITIVSFTGVDTSGTNGSGAIGAVASRGGVKGAPSVSLTTTRNNSWVFGAGVDWDTATARTLGPSQTLVNQYLATTGDTYWVQRQTSTTPVAGSAVTINDTAPTKDKFNLIICEILPALPVR